METILEAVKASLAGLSRPLRVMVGFSGGVDSCVLLHVLVQLRAASSIERLRAIHVHHGLMPDADAWVVACALQARRLDVELVVERVSVAAASCGGEEAAARRVRYQAFARHLERGELLCLAHHADDQAETLLIHLLRGSGPHGLRAMPFARPFARGTLVRPLLALRRRDLERTAAVLGLHPVEDAGNRDLRRLRNLVRWRVLPLLEEIRPGAVEVLNADAALQRDAAQAQDWLGRRDAAEALGTRPGTLSRRALAALPGWRRRGCLRWWLRDGGLSTPQRRRLVELERQLVEARPDRNILVTWPRGEVRTHGDDVHRRMPDTAAAPDPGPWLWRTGEPLDTSAGVLSAEPVVGQGLARREVFEVRVRRGGERCRPLGRRHSQTLKRLLQEYRVAPWERPSLPLIFARDRLAAVADLFVCHGFDAAPGEPGLKLVWCRRIAGGITPED